MRTGVALVLPGCVDDNLISGINEVGDNALCCGGCREFAISIRGTLIDVFVNEDVLGVLCGVELVLADCCGDVADQSELFGDCIGCTRKCSCTKLKSCLCCVVGGKNGLALSSDDVGVGIVCTLDWLGDAILKFDSVGVPIRVGVSLRSASKGLIIFDSISVDPYDTNVESCVGKDNDALRLPLSRCRVSVLARLTVYGFSFSGFVSSISGDVGIFVKPVTSL